MTNIFDYKQFVSLSDLELCHYMEPLVADPDTNVPDEILLRMLADLPNYDSYHLVYALTLGSKSLPSRFAMELPAYLAHEDGSVWSTALNGLANLPSRYVKKELVDAVREIHTSNPNRPWIRDSLKQLERRFNELESSGRTDIN